MADLLSTTHLANIVRMPALTIADAIMALGDGYSPVTGNSVGDDLLTAIQRRNVAKHAEVVSIMAFASSPGVARSEVLDYARTVRVLAS